MIIKASDIVSFVVNAKNEGWGYVYSGQGQLYTSALAEQWGRGNRAGRGYDYFVKRCARWFGHIVVDCSGLIVEAYRSRIPGYEDMSANTVFSRAVQSGSIDTIPEIPGLCVWHRGHIGVYIGNRKIIEAAGTETGVILSHLKAPGSIRRWTHWGMMADVDYTGAVTVPVEEPPACWLGRYLRLVSPYMRGDDILQVQQVLQIAGLSPGPIDGVYGPRTQNAVMAFQAARGLAIDGIIGPDTTRALWGVWITDCDGKPCCPGSEPQTDSFKIKRLIRITIPFMRGDDVRDVQDALALYGFSPGGVDGIYGPRTHGAVIAFQQAKYLTVDGIVGPKTAAALGGVWTGD